MRCDRLRVLSLNAFVRPEGIHSGKWFSQGDHKDLRVTVLLRKMVNYDVVILQEMFEVGWRQQRLVKAAAALGFKYFAGSVWPSLTDRFLIDGGLLILSRFPIVERAQHAYSCGAGSDGVCSKGVLYARIQLSPDLSDSIHVFTTHTQSGDNEPYYSLRAAQLRELTTFVKHVVSKDEGVPVLVTGDLNMDARHDLKHDSLSGQAVSTPCIESSVYRQFIADLRAALPSGREVQDLMKLCCTSKLPGQCHPITNGDGHCCLKHISDPLSPLKDGKCIDYMLYSPSSRDQSSTQRKPTRISLSLVPEKTQVDHCAVGPLLQPSETVCVSHLSDHYGLGTEFTIEVDRAVKPDGNELLSREDNLIHVLQQRFPPHAFKQRRRIFWRWKLWAALVAISTSISILILACLSMLSLLIL